MRQNLQSIDFDVDGTSIGVVVVDHGSRRQESNAMLLEVVREFQSATGFAIVEPAHMELAEPSIDAAFSRCVERGATTVVVFPYFLSPGRHWNEDIPRLAAAAASKHAGVQYLVTAPFGLHPLMSEIMRQRIEHCLAHTQGHTEACEFCAGTDHCQRRVGASELNLIVAARLVDITSKRSAIVMRSRTVAGIGKAGVQASPHIEAAADSGLATAGVTDPGYKCFHGRNEMNRSSHNLALLFSAVAVISFATRHAEAGTPFVPGTGSFLRDCCDDFENPAWSYRYNHPKSSHEQDDRQRSPGGRSSNNLWHEGGKRGTPDLVKRVETPLGGIPGSTGALMFATRNSGIPGRVANSQQQDDLLMLFDKRLGRSIPMAWQPSCTVRVYLPPFEEWENRTGPQFGMRADCTGRNPDGSVEAYWPGMFLLFQSQNNRNIKQDSAKISVRGDKLGHDIRKVDIAEPGWWTLGMSFTSDGQVHYYASEGVDDLTSEDHIMSSFPYSMRCMTMNNFFFNVANWENGRSWSSKWVIDDPKVFVQPPPGQTAANLYRIKKKPQQTAKKQQMMRSRSAKQPASSQRSASTSRMNPSR